MIRGGCPADAAWMYAVELECFPAPWSRDSFERDIWLPPFEVLAEEGPDGAGRGYLIYHRAADEAHVLNLAVTASARRQGVARRLLQELHARLQEAGTATVYLELRISNRAALALYCGFGYNPVGMRRAYYTDNNEDALVMAKRLAGEAGA
jgi:ribosomal-protein-alanine N-acetyltransferase